MQRSIYFITLLIWILGAGQTCQKHQSPYKSAVITGFDMRYCTCCGGLMINFDNNPVPLSGDFYLIANTPSSLGITEETTFPVYMDVIWEKKTACINEVIYISSFVKR